MRKIGLIFLLFGCFAVVSFAQPAGYAVAENEISNSFPVMSEKNSEIYKANISRKFANEKEERLLKIAEVVYPTAEEKQKLCSKPGVGNPAKANWACNSFDDVLIPFAVTKAAVVYYLNKTDELRKNKAKTAMKSSSLNYSAEINFHPNFEANEMKFTDVYVVSMRLSWSQVCGDLCALSLGKDRTVVLDKNGKVLFVSGDGETPFMVS